MRVPPTLTRKETDMNRRLHPLALAAVLAAAQQPILSGSPDLPTRDRRWTGAPAPMRAALI